MRKVKNAKAAELVLVEGPIVTIRVRAAAMGFVRYELFERHICR
jgi:hypothetical protein